MKNYRVKSKSKIYIKIKFDSHENLPLGKSIEFLSWQ